MGVIDRRGVRDTWQDDSNIAETQSLFVVSSDPEAWLNAPAQEPIVPRFGGLWVELPEEAACDTPDCPCSPDWPEIGGEG